MRKAKQSTAKNVMVLMVDGTDHVTGKTGLTLTVAASKNGAAFATITPTVTDRGSGWYSVALTTAHTDTLGDFALHLTGVAADPSDLLILVEAGSMDADVSSRSTFAGGAVASVTGSVGSVAGLNPALLDVAVSTRMATFTYTAPDNTTLSAINSKLPALVGGRIDASVGAVASGAITASAIASGALNGKGDWNIGKTGFSLTQTFPANFASLEITAGGAVTSGTVSDKTGYSVSAIGAGVINSSVAPNLDASVSSRMAAFIYSAPDNASVAAIKAKTDTLVNAPSAAEVTDSVWNKVLA